jgi:hypothetical protein
MAADGKFVGIVEMFAQQVGKIVQQTGFQVVGKRFEAQQRLVVVRLPGQESNGDTDDFAKLGVNAGPGGKGSAISS